MALTALPINCTLKFKAGEASSTDAMIAVVAAALTARGVTVQPTIRMAAHAILPGVTSDEGDGDDWPHLREKILAADILVFGTPIWMGQPCSVAKRVLERMDAFISETDDQGRMPPSSKVAVAAIVGNEDGAHHVWAELGQALNDVGWTIPAVGACYWVGEAMGSKNFNELDPVPEKVRQTAATVATNAAHLAGLLAKSPYPGADS
ncbi:flavodoxin family protein [Sphingomonas profundi]|uniref:flavodoxin family protein n=1 Tax=Alterirhizorhabdus profundi TaxID=2681549 RepID=UPI0012E89317|nr:NAD(P)H-dependent oxidoreductase [Sphingomonas profundi]